jgi:hypothetical protein
VARYLAGLASCLLVIVGAVLFWQARADRAEAVPMPPPPQAATSALAPLPEPPEATPKSREQKRFARADKDDDGRITAAELYEPRRKAFAKLDVNGNGVLSFEEWAVKTIGKFEGADADRSGWLTPAEYSTTAPPPPKKKVRCSC